MKSISETDLILNPDGSVYHLSLRPEHIEDTIIAVGDPNRVRKVSRHFEKVSFEMNKREFVTHVGTYQGKQITVISTGIGTDNIEIFMTEIDALVNIELASRVPKENKRGLKIIRIGTSGALQEDIPVGSHLLSEYGIGLDNLMQFYKLPSETLEHTLAADIQEKAALPFKPYVVKGSAHLLRKLGAGMLTGNTLTAPGFYAPQGRQVRAAIKFPGLLDALQSYRYGERFRLTNFEMETAAYYAFGRLLGHEMMSANAIIANRIKNEFATDPERAVDDLIVTILGRV